ncbi:MAG: hypothetical protein Q4G04_01270 [bacterium]|nr:hypothetical protein [bacterium]
MSIEELKKIFLDAGEVKFRLYSLDYVITKTDNGVIIYPIIYDKKQIKYDSIDELLNSYLIYNETIIQNENKIMKIEQNV